MARAACGMSDIELLAVVVVLPLVFVAELGWPMAWLWRRAMPAARQAETCV
jgi:hypothetical protein